MNLFSLFKTIAYYSLVTLHRKKQLENVQRNIHNFRLRVAHKLTNQWGKAKQYNEECFNLLNSLMYDDLTRFLYWLLCLVVEFSLYRHFINIRMWQHSIVGVVQCKLFV